MVSCSGQKLSKSNTRGWSIKFPRKSHTWTTRKQQYTEMVRDFFFVWEDAVDIVQEVHNCYENIVQATSCQKTVCSQSYMLEPDTSVLIGNMNVLVDGSGMDVQVEECIGDEAEVTNWVLSTFRESCQHVQPINVVICLTHRIGLGWHGLLSHLEKKHKCTTSVALEVRRGFASLGWSISNPVDEEVR